MKRVNLFAAALAVVAISTSTSTLNAQQSCCSGSPSSCSNQFYWPASQQESVVTSTRLVTTNTGQVVNVAGENGFVSAAPVISYSPSDVVINHSVPANCGSNGCGVAYTSTCANACPSTVTYHSGTVIYPSQGCQPSQCSTNVRYQGCQGYSGQIREVATPTSQPCNGNTCQPVYQNQPAGSANATTYTTTNSFGNLAQSKANQAASRGIKGHVGGGLGGARYEGVGWSTSSAESALQSCCYWGSRPVAQMGVARGHDGWYACVLYH